MKPEGERELSLAATARELGLKERQVRNLFYNGKLRGRYLSERRIVIFASSIKDFQETLEKEKGLGRRHLTLFPKKV